MPAGQDVWIDIAKNFKKNDLSPKLWFGDPRHNSFAKQEFPECEVLDFSKLHKEIGLKSSEIDINPDVLFSNEFLTLKDQVYKIMDRQDDLGIYGRLNREAFFYYLFTYFFNKINKSNISLAIAGEGPHSPISMIIYGICKILRISTYHLAQNSLIPVAHIAKDFYGTKLNNNKKLESYNKDLYLKLVADYVDSINEKIPTPLYMQIQNANNRLHLFKDIKKYILSPAYRYLKYSYPRLYKQSGADYAIYKPNFFDNNNISMLHEFKVAKKKSLLKTQYSKISIAPDLTQEYVFVPLHYEPERTSNPDGGYFYNVYDMIVALRSFVPENIAIILKEHPSQFTKDLHGNRGRSPLFYEAIASLPNIIFANIEIESNTLIRNSLFVATQTGTAALESAIIGRKGLIFGTPWFLGTPNLYNYGQLSFDDLIRQKVYSKLEVKNFLLDYITNYTLPVCVNPSGYKYYSKKYPDKIDDLLDNAKFSQDLISIIIDDFQNQ